VKIISRTGLVLVASPSLVAAHGQPTRPEDLPGYPTLSATDRPGLDRWKLKNDAGEAAEVLHEPRLSASEWRVLREAALSGVGIALLPEYACREFLRDGQLVQILPDWSVPEGVLHMVFTSRRGLLPGVRAVIDFAADALSPRSAVWDVAD
jgi:DNA-binding transcriptional LysR family regulator